MRTVRVEEVPGRVYRGPSLQLFRLRPRSREAAGVRQDDAGVRSWTTTPGREVLDSVRYLSFAGGELRVDLPLAQAPQQQRAGGAQRHDEQGEAGREPAAPPDRVEHLAPVDLGDDVPVGPGDGGEGRHDGHVAVVDSLDDASAAADGHRRRERGSFAETDSLSAVPLRKRSSLRKSTWSPATLHQQRLSGQVGQRPLLDVGVEEAS